MASIGDIVRLAMFFTQPSASNIMNVFHFMVDGADITNPSLIVAIDNWVTDIWGGVWENSAASNAQLDRWEADIVNPDGTVASTIGGQSVNKPGLVSGDVLPAGVAGYVLAYTDVPKARGSKYIPCLAESRCVNGTWDGTALADLAAILLVYLADASMGGGTFLIPGVLSKVLEEFLPFRNSGTVDDRPAYQRRRKSGVGA